MTEEEIKTAILTILATIAPDADLKILMPGTPIQTTLDMDSYDMLNLMIGISKQFGVDIPEETYGRLGSLDTIIQYIQEQT